MKTRTKTHHRKTNDLPLEGIRVIELCQAFSGPLAGLILADLGAEVIKLERPKIGDEARLYGPTLLGGESVPFLVLNRNKKGISLDLKKEQGKKILLSLLEKSDVLIENFTPGTMSRLGLEYETVCRKNPSIIYCSISAYGQKGPLCQRPGYEATMQAFTGIVSLTGDHEGEAYRTGVPILDSATGVLAGFAITIGLFERERTGKGKYLDICLLDAAASLMLPVLGAYFNLKKNPNRVGNQSAYGVPTDVFKTSTQDIMIFATADHQWRSLCRILDRENWLEDPKFKTNQERMRNRQQIRTLLADVLKTRPAEEWMSRMKEQKIPCSPIHKISDFVENEQFSSRGYEVNAHSKSSERITLPQLSFLNKINAQEILQNPPPSIGEHTRSILKEYIGLDPKAIQRLEEEEVIFS
jgi:crotonobetainyl-CoA:carnitine CoA-transferase CaiB-like acyl-CoA transferase